MNKTLLILALIGTFGFQTSAQSKLPGVATQIITLEKAGWEAWKNKDASWTQKNTTEEFLSINADGVSNKKQVIKSTASDCKVEKYALSNFKFVKLTDTVVILTYEAIQKGTCGGKKLTLRVRSTVNYVKRNGILLEALYVEVPVTK